MAGIFDHVYFDDQKSETGDDQILNLLGAHEKAHGGEALREPTEDELSMQWHTIASARFFALLETIIENPNSPVLGPEEVGAVAALFRGDLPHVGRAASRASDLLGGDTQAPTRNGQHT